MFCFEIGEHKIIDFVRKQKAQSDYNPNLRHCLCGADADLIMLGLATHELDFTILREEFIPNQPKACDICAQYGHETKECQGKANVLDPNLIKNMSTSFIYIRLSVLREYLEKECDDLDFERYIDDFVLLCFFVGNDFLPHLPSLEIRENAIDKLLRIYKDCMSQYSHPKPYITDNGFVSLHKVQMILNEFGKMEDEIFVRRKINEERYKMRMKKQKMLDHKALNSAWLAPVPVVGRGQEPERLENVRKEAVNLSKETLDKEESMSEDKQDASSTSSSPTKQTKRKIDESLTEDSSIDQKLEEAADSDQDEDDDVQLWNSGWKERYYLHKFDCKNHTKISDIIAKEYVVGLCWVMRYYYQGCVDWQWYYPFHYAPFASDFKKVENIKVEFNRDAKPFRPLEQLMSVFPAASGGSLPRTWQELMKSPDSNIIDFYPKNFKIDLNGKKQAWQGVALLPFIDERRLFSTLEKVYPDLTAGEVDRNQLGENLIFISKLNQELSNTLTNGLKNAGDDSKFDFDSGQMHDIKGKLRKSKRYTDEVANSFCLEYFDPVYAKEFVFPAKRLPEAILPERVLKPEDFRNNNYNNNQRNYQRDNRSQQNRNNNYNNNNNQRQNNSNSQYYRPVIGFTRSNQQASISDAGHRTLDFYNRPNYNNSSNFQNNRQNNNNANNYRQSNNYQTNYQATNYQPQLGAYQQAYNSYQQQSPFQLNYQQQAYQSNYLAPSYTRRDNLNPYAQDFIPSYDQVPNEPPTAINQPPNTDQSNRYNNLNQRPNQNRQNR